MVGLQVSDSSEIDLSGASPLVSSPKRPNTLEIWMRYDLQLAL